MAVRRPEVLERHVDAVLYDHLSKDEEFSRSLVRHVLDQCAISLPFATVAVRRQVRHEGTSGTIDLLVVLLDHHATEVGRLLIENKLDSGFTPDQPQRYVLSARTMSTSHLVAIPVICAPRDYPQRSKHLAPFAARFAYEDVLTWLRKDERALVEDAILRFEMPYEPEPVAQVASFHEGYVALARERAPALVVKRNPNTGGARPSGSRTIYFVVASSLPRYSFLPTLRFSHQCWDSSAASPSVKVMIDGWARHEGLIRRIAAPGLAGTEIYVRRASSSLAFAIDTPRMDNTRSVAVQAEAVVAGLDAALALRQWMYSNEPTLKAWAAAVTSAR